MAMVVLVVEPVTVDSDTLPWIFTIKAMASTGTEATATSKMMDVMLLTATHIATHIVTFSSVIVMVAKDSSVPPLIDPISNVTINGSSTSTKATSTTKNIFTMLLTAKHISPHSVACSPVVVVVLVVVSVAEDSSVPPLLGKMSPGIRAHTLINICINHNTKFGHNWLEICLRLGFLSIMKKYRK